MTRLKTMAATKDHLIGLLLGAEEDWPQAFEADPAARRARSTTDGRSTTS